MLQLQKCIITGEIVDLTELGMFSKKISEFDIKIKKTQQYVHEMRISQKLARNAGSSLCFI